MATPPSTKRPSQSVPQPAPTIQRASQSVPQTAPTIQRASQSVPQAPPTIQRVSQSGPRAVPPSQQASQSTPQRASQVLEAVLPQPPSTQRASQVVEAVPPQPSSTQRASQSSPSRRSSLSKQTPPSQPAPQRASQRASQSTSSRRPSQTSPPPRPGSRRSSKSEAAAPPQTSTSTQTQTQPDPSQSVSGTQPQSISPQDQLAQTSSIPPPAPVVQPASHALVQTSPQSASPVTTVESSLEAIQSKLKDDQTESEPWPQRALPLRERPAKIMRRISLEMRHRMYLMGMRIQYSGDGPIACNFFVMGDIGKTFVVKVRKFPCCQCGDFLLERICKHMTFISLRVFRLKQSDHRIWQQALLPSELSALLAHPLITPAVKPVFTSRFRKAPPPDPPQQEETPICCPVCFDEIQFFDNEIRKPLGGPRGPKPKLEMGTRRKKEDAIKVEEALAEPWAARTKKFESLLHCTTPNCQAEGCPKIVHRLCYLKWNRFRKMGYDLPRICTPNNFYPCAFKCH